MMTQDRVIPTVALQLRTSLFKVVHLVPSLRFFVPKSKALPKRHFCDFNVSVSLWMFYAVGFYTLLLRPVLIMVFRVVLQF